MPKVAADLRTSYPSGIFRYGSCLVGRLAENLARAGVTLAVLHGPNLKAAQVEALAGLVGPHGAELVRVPDEVGFGRDSAWLREWLVGRGVKLYYSFNYLVDDRCPVPYVFTIYDLIRLKHPDYSYTDDAFRQKFGAREFEAVGHALKGFEEEAGRGGAGGGGGGVFARYFRAVTRRQAARSLSVVTISEAVKADVVRVLGVPPGKVSVVPGAAHERFRPRGPAEVSAALGRFGLNAGDPYCLFVGTHHPHKRLPWLLDVLAGLRAELPPRARLVVTGKHREGDWSEKNLVGARGLGEVVVFTGEVGDDELACLYTGARALAVSSVDEGFCLPALEALCCGCEVVAPELPVMRETTGGRAHFYPPDDARRLALHLREAFGGSLPRRARGFRSRFNWATSAEGLTDLLLASLSEAGRGGRAPANPAAEADP